MYEFHFEEDKETSYHTLGFLILEEDKETSHYTLGFLDPRRRRIKFNLKKIRKPLITPLVVLITKEVMEI